MPNDPVLGLLNKCSVLFEDEIISSSLIMSTFVDYIAKLMDEAEKSTSLIYHTGSQIFDIMLTLYVALSCIVYDELTPADLVESLSPGDIVIFENKRAKFLGLTADNKAQVMYNSIHKGYKTPTTVTMPPKSFYKLKPYYGEAKILNGSGIRIDSKSKFDFLQTVFKKSKSDIAGIGKKSAVIVCDRDFADSFVDKVRIRYDGVKYIGMTDLMPVSYFSEGNEYPFRGNPGKNTPVLKFTNKASIARELIFTDEEKQVFAFLITGVQAVKNGETELPDIINRRSLKKALISLPIADYDGHLCAAYPDASVFACTKDMLLSYSMPNIQGGPLTCENELLIDNIINQDIIEHDVDSIIDIEEFRAFRRKISDLRHHKQNDEIIDRFIIESYSLMNYFSNIPFPIHDVEIARQEMNLECPSALEKKDFLANVANDYSGALADLLSDISRTMNTIFHSIECWNPKMQPLIDVLENVLQLGTVLLLVPKPFYIDIFKALLPTGIALDNDLHIKTTGAFDSKDNYDTVVSIGCLGTKRFSIFSTFVAPRVECLLYPHERLFFNYQKKLFVQKERELNNRSILEFKISDINEEEQMVDSDILDNQKIEEYLEGIAIKSALQAASNVSGGAATKADIVRIATTSDGESIFFTKYFTPYIFDRDQMTVVESAVKDIAAGDMLLFTKNSDQAKDIIEEIIKKLAATNEQINEAFRKSRHWKEQLLAYKDAHRLSFQDLSDVMKEYGTPKHPVTLRTWLNPESRIIAPREEDAFFQVALICEDDEMIASPESFYEACNTIRSLRIKILKLIGQSVIKNYQQAPDETAFLSDIVKEELSALSQIVQVDTIIDVSDIQISISYTNRPCAL